MFPKSVIQLFFQPNTQQFRRCLEYATAKVRNQNELAVNGHEVQRRMEAAGEKFAVSNFPLYSDKLRLWKDEVVNHPLITNSDQVDIHWAILQLILDVAQHPVDAMTDRVIRNDGKLIEFPQGIDEPEADRNNALIESLLTTNVIEDKSRTQSDELSDWSDEDCSYSDENIPEIIADEDETNASHNFTLSRKFSLSLRPPEKESHYTELLCGDSEKWFQETTQNNWWSQIGSQATANSSFSSADFAHGWNKYLDTLSLGLIADKNLSTTSEYVLIREIIWMLISPAKKCKFFRVENNCVALNSNVSTTSCSLPIIQSFLGKIIGSLSHLLELKAFVESVRGANANSIAVCYEIYSGCLLEHIHALEKFALDVETRLMEQNDAMTSLAFIEALQENHLRIIDSLHMIHKDALIEDWTKKPNYVLYAVLMAKLWQRLEYPLLPMENNLTISLLVPLLRSFLCVFDSWWSLGRLHDYTDEFPLTVWGEERVFTSDHQELVDKCPLIRFLVDHCKESHVLLTHLNSMNRTNILNELSSPIRGSYEEFLGDFLKPFKVPARITEETQTESPAPTNEYYCELMELLQLEEQTKNEHRKQQQKESLTSWEMFAQFQGNYTNFTLPFLELMLKSLDQIIAPRIETVHNRVAKIFLEEYKIVNHFRNTHWVLLLESPAMYDFFTDVFMVIETNYNNLSSHQLTAKLEACLNAVHPQMDSLFTVEVDPHYYKTELDTILDCLTKLRIEYNFHAAGVLDFNSTPIYNKAFQFLLQIKWALWLLENLKLAGNHNNNLTCAKFFREPNVLDFSIRRMGILRFWMLSSIKNIHSYLMHNVVEGETLQLEKSVKKCTSIAKIQRCHGNFLATIESKCFLAEGQRELMATLQEFLHFILVFRDVWQQLQDLAERDYRLESKESKKILMEIRVDQLEETYSNIHHLLTEKLQEQTRDNIDAHGK